MFSFVTAYGRVFIAVSLDWLKHLNCLKLNSIIRRMVQFSDTVPLDSHNLFLGKVFLLVYLIFDYSILTKLCNSTGYITRVLKTGVQSQFCVFNNVDTYT